MRANSSHLSARVPLGALPSSTSLSSLDARRLEVTHHWGDTIVAVHRFAVDDVVTIGSAVDDDIAVGTRSWTLLSGVLRIDGSMHGTITRHGQTVPLAQAATAVDDAALAIVWSDDAKATIAIGAHTLQLRTVQRSPVASVVAFFDALWANAALLTTFATAVVLAAAFFFPIDIVAIDDTLRIEPLRVQTLLLRPPPKDNAFLARMKAPPGKSTARRNDVAPSPTTKKHTATREQHRSNEVVVADKLAQLFGSDGVASVFNGGHDGALATALGSLDGVKVAGGSPGGGLRGDVGVVQGTGTIGGGRITTRGGGEAGYGVTDGEIGAHTEREIEVTTEPPQVHGSIDAEAVRRIVRSHAGQIRYCYERALPQHPGLAGKIVMKWTVDAAGKVQHATVADSQLHNAEVEGCIASRVKTWVFPSLKGGGIAVITYPFVLRQAG